MHKARLIIQHLNLLDDVHGETAGFSEAGVFLNDASASFPVPSCSTTKKICIIAKIQRY